MADEPIIPAVAPVVEAPAPAEAAPVETPAAVEPAHEAPKSLLEAFDAEDSKKEAAPAAEPAKEPEKAPVETAKETPVEKVVEPESSEPIAYDALKLPDGFKANDEQMGQFTTLLGEVRVPPEKAQALLDLHAHAMQSFVDTYAKQALDDQWKAFNDTRATWRTEVMADPEIGGSGHQTAMRAIAQVRDQFVPASDKVAFDHFLQATGAGDHPAFLRMLHRMSKISNEPGLPPPNPRPTPNGGAAPKKGAAVLYDHPSSGRG